MNVKLKILAFVAVMVVSVIGPAKAAAIYDGNEILFSCKKGNLKCIYYLAGVHDARNDLDSKEYCMPDDVKLAELKEVFIQYAKENPEKLNFSASSVTTNAFNKAFPCE